MLRAVFPRKLGSLVVIMMLCIASSDRPSLAESPVSLVVEDMDGVSHDIDELLASGETVVLVFWATWCPQCRIEAPELSRAVTEYEGEIRFFGVVAGSDEDIDDAKVLETARKWELPQPQVRDRDLALTHYFGARGTPDIIVLGTDREVLYRSWSLPESWKPFRATARRSKSG